MLQVCRSQFSFEVRVSLQSGSGAVFLAFILAGLALCRAN